MTMLIWLGYGRYCNAVISKVKVFEEFNVAPESNKTVGRGMGSFSRRARARSNELLSVTV
jgi:hypothetical protein